MIRVLRGHTIVAAVMVLVFGVALAVFASWPGGAHQARNGPPSTPVVTPSAPSAGTSPPPVTPTAPSRHGTGPSPLVSLPQTGSADVYAAAAARALWGVDYSATPRDALIKFWQDQLAGVLPADVPPGTTLVQAQAAGLSTVEAYLPAAGAWGGLARDRTVSSFTVTGVSEPPSWVAAVSSGQITDPGLTARTVIGVQTISYGAGTALRTVRQTQQLTLAMLCPPTTASCRVEVFEPPDNTAGQAQ